MKLSILYSALLVISEATASFAQVPMPISPVGATSTKTPVFEWKHVGAQEYEIHMIAPVINRSACGGVIKRGCIGNRDPNAGCDKYYAFGRNAVLAGCKNDLCRYDSAHPIPGVLFFSVLQQQCNGEPYKWKWSVRAKLSDGSTGPESPLELFYFQPGVPQPPPPPSEPSYIADCVCRVSNGSIAAHWTRKPLGIGKPINQIIRVTASGCTYVSVCGPGGTGIIGGATRFKVTNISDTSGGMVYNYSLFGAEQ